MSDPQIPALSDRQHADKIRELIKDLSLAVNMAKQNGLDVNLNLAQLGQPQWVGYHDAGYDYQEILK